MTVRSSAEWDDIFINLAQAFVLGDFTIAAVTLIDPCKWTSPVLWTHGGIMKKKSWHDSCAKVKWHKVQLNKSHLMGHVLGLVLGVGLGVGLLTKSQVVDALFLRTAADVQLTSYRVPVWCHTRIFSHWKKYNKIVKNISQKFNKVFLKLFSG